MRTFVVCTCVWTVQRVRKMRIVEPHFITLDTWHVLRTAPKTNVNFYDSASAAQRTHSHTNPTVRRSRFSEVFNFEIVYPSASGHRLCAFRRKSHRENFQKLQIPLITRTERYEDSSEESRRAIAPSCLHKSWMLNRYWNAKTIFLKALSRSIKAAKTKKTREQMSNETNNFYFK